MNIVLRPRSILVFLFGAIVVLLLAHLASQFFLFQLGWSYRNFWLIKLFDMGREGNIPTLYSTLLLLSCTLLLCFIYRHKKEGDAPGATYWLVLATIFLFLGIDEMTTIHEKMIKPLRAALDTSGIFYFAWVLPYGIFLLAVTLIFLRFVLSLPTRIRNLVLLAGGLYAVGVVGFEMLGGWYADLVSTRTPTYALIVIFEESLEIAGLSVFVYALLSYFAGERKDILIAITTVLESPRSNTRDDP